MRNQLIRVEEAVLRLQRTDTVFVDCRFSMDEPDAGRSEYMRGHIPGAVYAHLDRDLSGEVVEGLTGRHPLPDATRMRGLFSSWGIGENVTVVAYDDGPGVLAARLWWLLRWQGHHEVRVLDGGWSGWTAARRPVSTGVENRQPARFEGQENSALVATTADVREAIDSSAERLIDARLPERYSGEHEPLDAVGGHIPGAINIPYNRLISHGCIQSPKGIRRLCRLLIGRQPSDRDICYCGSGVTAAFNVLAFVSAGLRAPRLYVGSWSEWTQDPANPVCTADAPRTESARMR